MKRNNRKSNNIAKIGTIFLVSIMALAAAGAGYAMWYQDLTIDVTVSTGEVKVGIYDVSTLDEGPNFQNGGDLIPGADGIGTADPNHTPGVNTEGKNVASHNSNNDGTTVCTKDIEGTTYTFVDGITEVVVNAYPWYMSGTEIWITNGGTIPVKIKEINFEFISGNIVLLDYMVFDAWQIKEYAAGSWQSIANGIGYESLEDRLLCYQIEPCHTISVYIEFYFIEDIQGVLLPQGQDLSFKLTVTAAQWNVIYLKHILMMQILMKEPWSM